MRTSGSPRQIRRGGGERRLVGGCGGGVGGVGVVASEALHQRAERALDHAVLHQRRNVMDHVGGGVGDVVVGLEERAR